MIGCNSVCDIRVVRGYAMNLVREMLCLGDPFGVNIVSIEDIPGLVFAADTSTTLVLPFLQAPAKDGLVAAMTARMATNPEGAPMIIRQVFNSLVDAYVLWSWTYVGMCGMKNSGRTYPLRPKDVDSFASGTWIEVEDGAQWSGLLVFYQWYPVQTTGTNSVVFAFRPQIGQLKDIHFRQVHAWQQWYSNQTNMGLNPSGVFDAGTQESMDGSPVQGYEPGACIGTAPMAYSIIGNANATAVAPRAGTLPNLPPLPNLTAAQNTLALVIIVPLSIVALILGVVVVMATFVEMSGPRLPLASKGRAHEDPYWRDQFYEAETARQVQEEDWEGATEWSEWEKQDPEIWSEWPSEWPTEDLEEEMAYMREHGAKRKYPPMPERQYPGDETSVIDSTEEAVAVAAPPKQPPHVGVTNNNNNNLGAQPSESQEDDDEMESDEDE